MMISTWDCKAEAQRPPLNTTDIPCVFPTFTTSVLFILGINQERGEIVRVRTTLAFSKRQDQNPESKEKKLTAHFIIYEFYHLREMKSKICPFFFL
ncbi:hypothetical protein ES332_D13G086400v1 [Gossypium tomentosum]|uniref:Uncharacterized protein n=1 Tax=Gossypium tomentosum TaxID=34277 RepID=A0A5D2HUL1_GOSTO|nr:hypothetical protein ES332_D13G086400v1 [Gossypium tomentosum]